MAKHKAKIEDFDARMEEVRARHKRPIVPENALKDRLKQMALKNRKV